MPISTKQREELNLNSLGNEILISYSIKNKEYLVNAEELLLLLSGIGKNTPTSSKSSHTGSNSTSTTQPSFVAPIGSKGDLKVFNGNRLKSQLNRIYKAIDAKKIPDAEMLLLSLLRELEAKDKKLSALQFKRLLDLEDQEW